MNVMMVADVAADVQVPMKNDPQDMNTQGFATELNRASTAEKTDTDGKTQAAKKTSDTDQPDGLKDSVKDEKSKETEQKQDVQLLQGTIPVIVQVQPQQIAVQAADPDEAAVLAVVQDTVNMQQTGSTQTLPQEAQNVQQTAFVLPDEIIQQLAQETAKSSDNKEAINVPETTQTEDKAVVFAKQALAEMESLQKAAANGSNQSQPVVLEMQPAVKLQSEDHKPAENTAVLVATEKNTQTVQTGEQTSGGDKKDNASQSQKQDTNALAQPQTPVWTGAGGTVTAAQFKVPQAEQSAVPRNVATSIVDNISTAVDKGNTEMVVQLKPEHLGGLAITLSMGESGLTAKMVTNQESVQNMIHNQLGILQEALREKGIQVVHMEVIYDQTQNSTNFSHNGNGNQWTAPQGNGNGGTYKDADESVNYYNFMSSYDVLAEHGGSVEFSA